MIFNSCDEITALWQLYGLALKAGDRHYSPDSGLATDVTGWDCWRGQEFSP